MLPAHGSAPAISMGVTPAFLSAATTSSNSAHVVGTSMPLSAKICLL